MHQRHTGVPGTIGQQQRLADAGRLDAAGPGSAPTWTSGVFNNAESAREVPLRLPPDAPDGRYVAAWGQAAAEAANGRLRLTVPPLGGLVLVRAPLTACS